MTTTCQNDRPLSQPQARGPAANWAPLAVLLLCVAAPPLIISRALSRARPAEEG